MSSTKFATCEYVDRTGRVCGKNCLKDHKESDRCALHRGRVSSVLCVGCQGCYTRKMSQLCTQCFKDKKNPRLKPMLLTDEEIDVILSLRKSEGDSSASSSEES